MIPPEPDGDDETRRDPNHRDPNHRDLDDASVDAAFADIVAMWRADAGREGTAADGGVTRGGLSGAGDRGAADRGANDPGAGNTGASDLGTGDPGDEVVGPGAGPAAGAGPGSGADRAAIDEIFAARRRRIEREVDAAVDGPDGGHFVPPQPAPLPQLDLFTLLAWAGALLGPLLIVIGAFTGGLIPRWIIGIAVAATIGGFVLLVSRLPRRGEADPEDNGAVV